MKLSYDERQRLLDAVQFVGAVFTIAVAIVMAVGVCMYLDRTL